MPHKTKQTVALAPNEPGPTLDGRWRVRRLSGLLPPGVTKQIASPSGETRLFGRLFGRFDVHGDRLVYRFWPIVDVVEAAEPGTFVGRGLAFGLCFCRFRLERLP
jgi:hypothetical protein